MKFKIGDKVRVKTSCKLIDGDVHTGGDVYNGKEGYVSSILKAGYHSWPYRVEFEGGFSNYFSARELEKAEEE